jgi:D-glycero-D-manno-heptose 1,7-bisphosphate phosphatase
MTTAAAIFLDRDGVLIREQGYVTEPAQIEVLPGVPEALVLLRRRGFRLVVVTNQSAIARGLLTEGNLARIHADLLSRLRAAHPEAFWDALYFCPHHPQEGRPFYRTDCDCRKPKPGMLLRAAAEHGLDLARSWMVGDAPRDLEAGRAAGCRTAALPGPDGAFTGADFADLMGTSLGEVASRLI